MLATAGSIHWAAIATVGIAAFSTAASGAWVLVKRVGAWREENAHALGELAGLVADWCDQVDDHLDTQDDALRQFAYRLGQLDGVAMPSPGGVFLPRRRRIRPRRMVIAETGLQTPGGQPGASDGIYAQRQGEGGGQPPV